MKGLSLQKIAFSKVEFWLVLLLMILAALACVTFGWVVKTSIAAPDSKVASPLAVEIATLPDYARQIFGRGVELNAAGQIAVRSPEVVELAGVKDFLIEKKPDADDGMLLVSSYNDQYKVPTVYLYDLQKKAKLWEWVPDLEQIVEMTPSLTSIADLNQYTLFRSQHPFLLEDGSILVSSGEGVLVKIDALGNTVWTSDHHFHHSIHRMADGNFIVPIIVDDTQADFRDDGYAIVSPDGNVLSETSIVGILKRNGFQGLIYGVGVWEDDRTHLNDAEPILESDGFVQKGDIVFSLRHLSTVFLYRPSEDKVIWLRTGPWITQHDVDYLGNGRFSIFGNDCVRGRGFLDYGNSNVYVYDMCSGEITKPYHKVFEKYRLQSPTQGLQRILDNGDVVIELSDAHQLMRLDADKIQWIFVNYLGENKVGALHWSRYFYRNELDLSWLNQMKIKNEGT